jgi:hypothetical protein
MATKTQEVLTAVHDRLMGNVVPLLKLSACMLSRTDNSVRVKFPDGSVVILTATLEEG